MSAQANVVTTVDTRDFARFFGKTSQVDAVLRRQLRTRIRAAANVAADASKQAVLGEPRTRSEHPRHRGLREGIASGITTSVLTGNTRVGVQIASTGRALGEAKRLARKWDLPGGFRHPVFGNRKVWVSQVGRPYFRSVVSQHRERVADAAHQAMQDAVTSLT